MKHRSIPTPRKAKLFCSLIYAECGTLDMVLERLEGLWGQIEFISARMDFSHTRYYEKEMGSPLYRKFLTFVHCIEQEVLSDTKWTAMEVEREFLAPQGGRSVNIDPGLLLPDKLVLATTKPCAHRPFLGKGIYADLTLIFEHGSYCVLPWTYPDYAASETRTMFNILRNRHRVESRWEQGLGA